MTMWKSMLYLLGAVLIFGCKPQEKKAVYTEGQRVISFDGYDMVMENGERVRFRSNDDSKIFFLFRHAEKNTIDTTDNPNLTDAGIERSEYIASMFEKVNVDNLFSTMYSRTMFTIDKLAREKGKKMRPYDPRKLGEFSVRLQTEPAGTNHVIVGHSNTTPDLANKLMVQSLLKQIDESDYDNLYVVEIDGENKNLKKLTFKAK